MPRESVNGSDSLLAAQLRRELEGDVFFDAYSRGRYSTDASMYQIQPLGVVVPRRHQDVLSAIQIAAEHDVPVLPRGAGTSQAGQTVGEALVIDGSKHLTSVKVFDPADRKVTVEPGIVLDELNRFLRPHGLFFPVDVSTSSRATIGGMAGNNSVGARSLHYGHMVDNVLGIQAILADGVELDLCASNGLEASGGDRSNGGGRIENLTAEMRRLYERNADEIARRYPQVPRNVAGYNINRLGGNDLNLAELLVGSEGTLAWFKQLELALQLMPPNKVLGVCHFPTFRAAMESAQHIVTLDPAATELIDRTVLDLAAEIPAFSSSLKTFIKGEPAAVLLVELDGPSLTELHPHPVHQLLAPQQRGLGMSQAQGTEDRVGVGEAEANRASLGQLADTRWEKVMILEAAAEEGLPLAQHGKLVGVVGVAVAALPSGADRELQVAADPSAVIGQPGKEQQTG